MVCVADAAAWPADVSLGSLFWGVMAIFIHTMFIASWAVFVSFMFSDWDWYPWHSVAVNLSMFSLFLLHVSAVNLCVTMWAIGLWRSSHRMARCAAPSGQEGHLA